MEFLSEVLDFCIGVLGEVFAQWMQNLARANRRLYIGLFGLLLLALAGGAAAFLLRSLWGPGFGLILLLAFALILFVMGLRKPKDRRAAAWQADRDRKERDRRTRKEFDR